MFAIAIWATPALGCCLRRLRPSTSLCILRCAGNGISAACAREHILPAVRANASLRTLHFHSGFGVGNPDVHPELAEAAALVNARN